MQRRDVLSLVATGSILLSGCSSSLSEPANSETMSRDRYPSYGETIDLGADEDFWVLELPGDYPSEAVYRYNIENLSPDQGAFDVLFFDGTNYRKYVDRDEPVWYTRLTTESVTSTAEQSARLQGYGGGVLDNSLYLVVDNTNYAATDPVDSGPLRASVNAAVYPNGVGPKPDVGDIGFEPIPETERNGVGPEWNLRVDLTAGIDSGTLKVDNCSGYSSSKCRPGNARTLEARRSLSDTRGVEYLEFFTDDQVWFDDKDYLFFVDDGDEVLAESLVEIDRSLELTDPRFESLPNTDTDGKSGFSVGVKNTGDAPVWLDGVSLTGDVDSGGYHFATGEPHDNYLFENEGYIPLSWLNGNYLFQIEPGETRRCGSPKLNVPEIDRVEQVCDGEPRTVDIRIKTKSGAGVRYELIYDLREPASKVRDGQDGNYVCESGDIHALNQLETTSA